VSHDRDEPLDGDVDGPALGAEGVAVRKGDPAGSTAPDDAARRRRPPIWQETVLLLGLAVVLAIVIKALFVQAFYIPSESMEPGLVENDRILVQKVSYWFGGSPSRGDVVVFEDPGGWLDPAESAGPTNPLGKAMEKVGLYPSGGHLVKRVVGVEGDVIECCDKQGRLLVNGEPLEEDDYVRAEEGVECRGPMPGCNWKVGPIPGGQLFVMGDNRNHSSDSSAHLCTEDMTDCTLNPYVDADLVVGKVFLLAWPRDRFDWLDRPATFSDVPEPITSSE
jgi:signal peptidase I